MGCWSGLAARGMGTERIIRVFPRLAPRIVPGASAPMSLNDPFGRQAAKQARDYAAVSHALREAGVDSLEAAERCLANIRRNAIVMVWLAMLSYNFV